MRYTQITSETGKLSDRFIAQHIGGIHKMACCDCGLVHDMEFTAWAKVKKSGKIIGYQKLSRRHVVVMVRAARNNPATYSRRHSKKFLKKGKSK